ncbi:hypothetical protein ETD86_28690 [Nonomuraea turkmeniaca]|uniref:WXG100 family type VII secretion target n=1 Tax=Nonomuraea turkmeniaca TaxID=103838 RepID=A0A5S4FAK3_9ACTN|nr:hypothetical protein [Nonomuraea turkmeniaca]TMR14398.1 hypothetical protein ETD86_28690 [Nonomuraea turkmeniaca]
MRLWDGTEIAKSIVDQGISQWSTMAEALEQESSRLITQVEDALAAAPWGGGAEGRAFLTAHFRGDGPNRMLTQCADLTKEITDAGTRVRQSVDNTLQTDADIKQNLAAGLTILI